MKIKRTRKTSLAFAFFRLGLSSRITTVLGCSLLLTCGLWPVRGANITLTANDANGAITSFNGAGKWSDSQTPASTNDYFTSQFFVRTPTDNGSTSYTFPGKSMTFQQPANGNARSIIVKSGNNDTFVINNLTNAFGGILENGGSGNVVSTFAGNFWTIAANSAVMANQGSLIIGYPLIGASGIVLTNGGGNAGGITYNGSNTLFQGIFYISSSANFGNGGGNTLVILNAPNAQPGNPSTFTPNQFWITAGCTLQDNVGLSFTNSNGGFLLNGPGNVNINAASATLISEPIVDYTNGVSSVCSLTKTGAGTLTLAANNNYSGSTIISAGTLQIGTPGALTNNSAVTDNGVLDLNGNNITINTLAGSGVVETFAGSSASLTVGSAGGSSTFTGTIQNSAGNLSLYKIGAGSLTLSGGFSYTGNTTVSGGSLNLTTAAALGGSGGSFIVSNSSLLSVDASLGSALPANNLILSTNSTLNLSVNQNASAINAVGNLNFQDNATVNLTYGTLLANPSTAAIVTTGGISAPGTNVFINVSATGLQPGTITLIKYGTGSLGSIANFIISPPPGVAANLVNNTVNQSIDLHIISIPNQLSWSGVNGASWDLSTPNWLNTLTTGITVFQQYTNGSVVAGDSIIFDDTLTNDFVNPQPTNIVLNARFYAFPVVENSTLPYSIAGTGGITGVTSLVKSNTGSLTLLTSNSFTGGVNISGGSLIVTNDTALGASSGAIILNGGTLQYNGSATNSRAISMPVASTIGVSTNNIVRLTGAISGAGASFNKTDNGTLVLAARETFTGDLFVHSGYTIIDSGGSITNGSYDDVGQNTADSATLTLQGTGALSTTSDFNVGDLDSSIGVLNITGSATLAVNAFYIGSANAAGSTAMGTVNQSGGSITEASASVGFFCIGGRTSTSAVGVYNMSGGSLTANAGIRVGSTGIGTMNQSGGTINAIGGINIARIAGSFGTNNLNGGTLSTFNVASTTGTNAVFNFNGGTLQANYSPSSSTAFGSSWFTSTTGTILAYILAGGAFVDSSNFNVTISVPLLAGSPNGGLTKKGTGTLNLGGINTFTGPITNNAGILNLAVPCTYPGVTVVNTGTVQVTSSVILQGGAVVNNNALLSINQVGSGDENMGNLTFNGAASGSGGTLALAPTLANNPATALVNCSTLTLNGTNTISVPLETVGTIAVIKYASLAGTGNCTNLALPQGAVGYISNSVASSTVYAVITSTGPGIVWTGTNSLAGHVNVWDITNTTNWLVGVAPTTYHQVVIPGDTVTFNDSGSGTVLLSNNVAPTSVTISNNAKSYAFSGPGGVSGPGSLLKLGSGTAILYLTNDTYTGSTIISNGALQIVNSGVGSSISPSGNLVISTNGSLLISSTIPNPTTQVGEFTGSGQLSYSGGFNSVLSFGGSAGGTWNGTINNLGGAGLSLTKNGTGTWIVGGTNLLNNSDFFNSFSQVQFNGGTTILTNGSMVAVTYDEFRVAYNGTATVTENGGTLAISNNWLRVGYGTGSTGTFVLNSGTVVKGGANNIDVGAVGSTGVLTVNGGQILNNGALWLADSNGASGTLNLNGGLVQASQLLANGSPASSIANFNGGTLQANTNNINFIDLSTTANIQTGGLVLDDGGFAIALPNGLQEDPSSTGGGLIKTGAGTVYLDGGNGFPGTTLVTNGLLAGLGSVTGPVVVGPAGNIGAGEAGAIGPFSVNNNLTIQGGATMRISVNGASPLEDQIFVSGNIHYGGVLTVTNITSDATPLNTSYSFQLFNVAGTPTGNFSGIAGSPGAGMAYSFNPANGTLSIVTQTIAPNPTNILFSVSGNALTLSWPGDHLGWILQARTNSISTGLEPGTGTWFDIPGSDSATNSIITINPINATVFYRLRRPF